MTTIGTDRVRAPDVARAHGAATPPTSRAAARRRRGGHRPLPAAALGAAAAAAPGAVRGRLRHRPTASTFCAELLDLTTRRGRPAVATFYTQYKRHPNGDVHGRRLHQHAVRDHGRRRDLRRALRAPRRRPRRDHRRRQDHPRARRVQRRLRLRAGGDGQLGVLRQPDARVGHASSSTTCAPASRSRPPAAPTGVHVQGGLPRARRLPRRPRRRGRRRRRRPRWRACGWPASTAGPRPTAPSSARRTRRPGRTPTRWPARTAHVHATRRRTPDEPPAPRPDRARRRDGHHADPDPHAVLGRPAVLDPRDLRAHGGYQALRKALAMDPGRRHRRWSRTPACAAAAAPASRPA